MLKVTQRDQRSEGRGGETKLASRSRFGTFDGAPLSSHLAAVDLLLWKKQGKKRLTRNGGDGRGTGLGPPTCSSSRPNTYYWADGLEERRRRNGNAGD